MRQHFDKTIWDGKGSLQSALQVGLETWAIGQHASRMTPVAAAAQEKETPKPDEWNWRKLVQDELKGRSIEAAVLERTRPATTKFRRLEEREIRPVIKSL